MDWLDMNAINWAQVIVYSGIAFVAALIAHFLNSLFSNNPLVTALLAALLFAAGFIVWNHYPHGINFGGQQQTVSSVAGS